MIIFNYITVHLTHTCSLPASSLIHSQYHSQQPEHHGPNQFGSSVFHRTLHSCKTAVEIRTLKLHGAVLKYHSLIVHVYLKAIVRSINGHRNRPHCSNSFLQRIFIPFRDVLVAQTMSPNIVSLELAPSILQKQK